VGIDEEGTLKRLRAPEGADRSRDRYELEEMIGELTYLLSR